MATTKKTRTKLARLIELSLKVIRTKLTRVAT